MPRRRFVRNRVRRRNGRSRRMQNWSSISSPPVFDRIVRIPFQQTVQYTFANANLTIPQFLNFYPQAVSTRLALLATDFQYYRFCDVLARFSIPQSGTIVGTGPGPTIAIGYANDIFAGTAPTNNLQMSELPGYVFRRQDYGDDDVTLRLQRRELVGLNQIKWWNCSGTVGTGALQLIQGRFWLCLPDAQTAAQATIYVYITWRGFIEFCGPCPGTANSANALSLIPNFGSDEKQQHLGDADTVVVEQPTLMPRVTLSPFGPTDRVSAQRLVRP